MSIPILVNLNMNGNQVLGLRLEVLAADPAGAALYEGRVWFNSTDNFAKYYDGTSIVLLAPFNNVLTGDLDAANHKIINLTDPVGGQDAVNYQSMLALVYSSDYKYSVRAATTGAISLTGAQTLDGVACVSGDRVLVKDQGTASQNGLYTVQSGAWTRCGDADANAEVTAGLTVFVSEGTTLANTTWVLTTDDPITVGSSSLAFALLNSGYIQAVGTQSVEALDWKKNVRAASPPATNITLSGTQTIDGVALVAGERVLLKSQTAPAENGIWVVAAGAWSRATDADSAADVSSGMTVYVSEGSINFRTVWSLYTGDPITVGTTGLAFQQSNNPMTTVYDLLMQGGAGVWTRLAKGAINTQLGVSAGGLLQYALIADANIDPAAAIALSKLAVNPVARANHTGTQLAATISDFDTQVRTSRLDQMAIPTAAISMGGFPIGGVADPVVAQQAATKAYVDAVAAGMDWKASVRAATVGANITLSGTQTLDGVVLVAGDRVLVKNQNGPTPNAANGIYVVAAGARPRATPADANAEVTSGLAVLVTEGTINGNTGWVLTTDDPITVGTTALGFTQFAGPGEYTAGTGLSLTGTQFALVTPVTVANGGTGGATVAAAKTSLGFIQRAAFNSLAATSTACTHNFGTLDVTVSVYEVATGAQVLADVVLTSVNVVTVSFAVAATAGQYRIVITG